MCQNMILQCAVWAMTQQNVDSATCIFHIDAYFEGSATDRTLILLQIDYSASNIPHSYLLNGSITWIETPNLVLKHDSATCRVGLLLCHLPDCKMRSEHFTMSLFVLHDAEMTFYRNLFLHSADTKRITSFFCRKRSWNVWKLKK